MLPKIKRAIFKLIAGDKELGYRETYNGKP